LTDEDKADYKTEDKARTRRIYNISEYNSPFGFNPTTD